MTDMDYEKVYKAVLQTATQWIKDGCTDKEKICLECVFPELRESEDERIRRGLIKLLTVASEAYLVESTGIKKDSYLAWLEKQKENPKNADSIPSDCVADAKCEDRWHKVQDSLPDNPREVLCKDEAGNYFIGRYYVGEGWEISNYDDEDKPHHLNPPVSKWTDFPSEKQKEQNLIMANSPQLKEQKPAEWSEEDEKMIRSILFVLESYVSEAECEQSPALTATYPTYYKEIDWLKSLRPSWKPGEDEERLINTSISFLKDFADKGYENAVECIDWLKSKLNGNSGK